MSCRRFYLSRMSLFKGFYRAVRRKRSKGGEVDAVVGGERLRSARNGKLGIWQEGDLSGYCEAQILDPSPSPLPAVLSDAVTDNQPAIRHRI